MPPPVTVTVPVRAAVPVFAVALTAKLPLLLPEAGEALSQLWLSVIVQLTFAVTDTDDDEATAARINHAGAIFIGPYSPEPVGDYFAGTNHVLPTGGAARFSSALGVYDFLKRTSVIRYTREELTRTAASIERLALAEGFEAHARSATIRYE